MEEYKPKINIRKSVVLIALAIAVMVVVVWLLRQEDFSQMLKALGGANHVLIVLAIAIYFASVALWATRWQTALSFINHRVSFAVRYLILCAAIFLNNITPLARVGGDPFGRVYMLHKLENTSYSSAMASSIGEHIFTPLVVFLFLLAGLLLYFGQTSFQLSLILIIAGALVAAGAIFVPRFFFKRRIAVKSLTNITKRVLGWLGRRGNIREIITGIETFYSSSYATIDRLKKVLLLVSLTLSIGVLDVLRLHVIFLALGYQPPISMLLLASSLPMIVGLIPFLPGGLILIEGSLISIFTLFGVPLDLALAATLIERGISFVLSTLVGAGVFSYLSIKMARKRVPINRDETV